MIKINPPLHLSLLLVYSKFCYLCVVSLDPLGVRLLEGGGVVCRIGSAVPSRCLTKCDYNYSNSMVSNSVHKKFELQTANRFTKYTCDFLHLFSHDRISHSLLAYEVH